MKVSIVIPSFNEAGRIGKCIAALKAQSLKPARIIVVDGNSTDGTAGVARKLGAKVIVEKKRGGAGKARNLGASMAHGDIIAFTDADSVPEKRWVEKIARDFQDGKTVCVGGFLKPLGSGLADRVCFLLFSKWFPAISSALIGFQALHGSNMAVARKAFFKSGGFDEGLQTIEDNELANRLKKFGRVAFDSSLWVETSERRFKRFGYAKELLGYWTAGFRLYVLGKKTKSYALAR